jgi:hypothetical protein
VVIWYIFSLLVCLDQEKSGNPGGKGGAGSANPSAIPPPQPPFIQLFFSITLLTGMTANSLLMGMTSVFSVTQAFFSLGTIQSAHHMANTTSCCFL